MIRASEDGELSYSLLLAARQLEASLTNARLIAGWECHDLIMNASRFACCIYLFLRCNGLRIDKIIHQRIIKKNCILRNNPKVAPQVIYRDVPDILTIDSNRAVINVVEPEQ